MPGFKMPLNDFCHSEYLDLYESYSLITKVNPGILVKRLSARSVTLNGNRYRSCMRSYLDSIWCSLLVLLEGFARDIELPHSCT